MTTLKEGLIAALDGVPVQRERDAYAVLIDHAGAENSERMPFVLRLDVTEDGAAFSAAPRVLLKPYRPGTVTPTIRDTQGRLLATLPPECVVIGDALTW